MQLLKSNIKRKISRKSKKSRKNKRNVIKTRKTRNSLKSMKNKVLRDINKNLKLKMKGGAISDKWSNFVTNINTDRVDYPRFSTDFLDATTENKKEHINKKDGSGFTDDGNLAGATSYNEKVNLLNSYLPDQYKAYNQFIELATARAITISNLSTLISLINRN